MWRSTLVAVLTVGLAFVAAWLVRAELGLEVSAPAIQTWIADLGWSAPMIYVVLVIFRHVLFIPSTLILPVGGLCFGVGLGTILGAAGIVVCGIGQFVLVRWLRPEWLIRRLGRGVWRIERILERTGAFLVSLVTAHPAAPMSPVHWAAGLSPMSLTRFTAAISAGAVVRTFALVFFGSTLLAPDSPRFYVATALLLIVFVGPLLHGGLRRRVFGPLDRAASEP